MDRNSVAKMVIEEMQNRILGSQFEANTVMKNGVEKLGIVRTDIGDVSPMIYADDIYTDLIENGVLLGEVFNAAEEVFRKDVPEMRIVDMLKNGETPPDESLTCRVLSQERISKDKDKFIIRNVADDLALVLEVKANVDDGEMRALLPKELYAEHSEEMFEKALKNLEDEKHIFRFGPDDESSLIVVSTESSNFGAASLFADGVLEELHENVGDFYALPCSVHEFIIIPKNEFNEDVKKLFDTVNMGNHSLPTPDEILSYSVYEYTGGELHTISN